MENSITPSLPIGDTISTAWGKIYGAKASIWAGVIIAQIALWILMMISGVVSSAIPVFGIVCMIASGLIYLLMQMGIYYIGIQRAKNLPVNYKMMYIPITMPMAGNVVGLILLQCLVLIIPGIIAGLGATLGQQGGIFGFVAFILYITSAIVSVYLVLSMLLGLGYVLEKNMGPLDAIKRSFDATKPHLIELFGIQICFILIYFVLAIPFGLGLIWGIPFAYVLYGEIFQRLSGSTMTVRDETVATKIKSV